ncbi:uncharacterized protein TRUGW13939_08739 [Talaromyces rugulosus]|uniref:Thioesterase domain-containing protein n=1 Tax=Talaromyces rugulosus TaxID=121627 RepID=A0A7H8R5W5_TALRU|nr:uncharacterized protein TRUGW13939_08739 [Talaromyces rugulosus]QKX61587.1 hypothetical protein TRUGW13939_08739 [Talaromyces rugulosus]
MAPNIKPKYPEAKHANFQDWNHATAARQGSSNQTTNCPAPPEAVMIQPLAEDYIPSFFYSNSWTASILSSPGFYPIRTWSRIEKPTEDGLFAKTLATGATIPYCVTLRRQDNILDAGSQATTQPPSWLNTPSSSSSTTGPPSIDPPDIVMILAVSDIGTCSYANTAHGGFLDTVLEEAMSLVVALHVSQSAFWPTSPRDTVQKLPRGNMHAAQLDTRYKGHVSVPGILVVRAKLVRKLGRKYWSRAQIIQEDDYVNKGEHGVSKVKNKTTRVDSMAFWLGSKDNAQL